MIPILYTSKDANAPVLNGTSGSLINVLTKCLVDGYGAKQPAGWTKEFENAEKTIAAFRNNALSGTGMFLRLDEKTAAANNVYVQCYEMMVNDTEGFGPFLNTPLSIKKSGSIGTSLRGWAIAATDKFFYLMIWYDVADPLVVSPTVQGSLSLFGDYHVMVQHSYNSIAAHGYGDWDNLFGLFYQRDIGSPGNQMVMASRNINGEVSTPTGLLLATIGFGPQVPFEPSQHTYNNGPDYNGVHLFIARPFITEGSTQVIRGVLPGFFNHCHNYNSFSNFQEVTNDGRTFTNFKFTHNTSSSTDQLNWNFFLELGVDWDVVN